MSVILFIILWIFAGLIAHMIGFFYLDIEYKRSGIIFLPLLGGAYLVVFTILSIIIIIMNLIEKLRIEDYLNGKVNADDIKRLYLKIKKWYQKTINKNVRHK